jgi:hypothetical protein
MLALRLSKIGRAVRSHVRTSRATYNEAVYDYLEKKNGKGWRERFDEECKKLEDRYHYKEK